ncbi:MAG: hypothetical protein BLM47_13085 [Candidatus Reconcilbacillus cellulovorans]|uniref:LUD domain-containing protein n=1 Tax=Candidatus Reconcilbacillus cellulovorans TaxID=1906605 RepID=A0A2A6DX79_9BACL|nr:MAG: hypothetical protein BLM47_13085 [Candidatus Reconcilbacillus cellulovorans]
MTAGAQYGRDDFLRRIAARLGRSRPLDREPVRDVVGVPEYFARRRADRAELVRRFVGNWEALGGKAFVVPTATAAEEVGRLLAEFVAEHRICRAARWVHPELERLGVDAALAKAGAETVLWAFDPSAEEGTTADEAYPARRRLIEAAESCELGVVCPDVAIADTGTIVLAAGPGRGRSVSLLPGVLFAVLPEERVVLRLGEAFEYFRAAYADSEKRPSSLNLITGPSRSSDIENDLTIGVHGPGVVYAVVVGDSAFRSE